MEFRKVFDTVPEQFDRYRPRYSPELFSTLIAYAGIGPGKSVLELGPGTGQATDPILNTGCDYNAIELGEHLFAMMVRKYSGNPNFHIVNDDFITHDFGTQKFDMIYSAATIQWIPEEIAFSKTFELLKPGGTLAMMLTKGDYKTPNEELYHRIQQVYSKYFKPETAYTHGAFGTPMRRTMDISTSRNGNFMDSGCLQRMNTWDSAVHTAITLQFRNPIKANSFKDLKKKC